MTKKKKQPEAEAKILRVIVFCPVLDKEVEVLFENIDIEEYSSDCGTCGSHGNKYADISCECGLSHRQDLGSW